MRSRKHLEWACGVLLLTVAAVLGSGANLTAQVTWQVPGNFLNIQDAILAASDGDTIVVAPGTYQENIDFLGLAITIESTDPLDPAIVESTVIDGDFSGSVVTFANGEGPDSVLRGFTIENGTGVFITDTLRGGGIRCNNTSPTIELNVIRNNTAERGGGCYLQGSSAVIVSNTFSSNVTTAAPFFTGGGAISGWISDPQISDNTFDQNLSGLFGGAIDLWGGGEITGNIFTGNTALGCGGALSFYSSDTLVQGNLFAGNESPQDLGGAIMCDLSSPLITENEFVDNVAERGGAIGLMFGSNPTIRSNLMDGNQASQTGGAIHSVDNDGVTISGNTIRESFSSADGGAVFVQSCENMTISGNLIHDNVSGGQGGGVRGLNSSLTIVCNTVTQNGATGAGGGMSLTTAVGTSVKNNIFWENDAPVDPEILPGVPAPPVTFCCVSEGFPGAGNIDLDPLFEDAVGDDFHLGVGSPCIDAGNTFMTVVPDEDCDGDPRILCTQIDIGCDEALPALCATSFVRGDANGSGDFEGLTDGLFILAFQFSGGPAPTCLESADADDDGVFNGLTDGLYVLNHQFLGGPPPAAPYPTCGVDPDPGTSLGCVSNPGCP